MKIKELNFIYKMAYTIQLLYRKVTAILNCKRELLLILNICYIVQINLKSIHHTLNNSIVINFYID